MSEVNWEERAKEAEKNVIKAAEAGNALIAELREMRLEKEAAMQKLHEATMRAESVDLIRSALQDDLDALRKSHSTAVSGKDEEIRDLKKKVLEKSDEIKDGEILFNEKIQELKSSLSFKTREIENLQKLLESAAEKKDEVNEVRIDDEVRILEEKIEALTVEKAEGQKATKELIGENGQLLEKIDELKKEVVELKNQVEESECEIMGYQQNLNQLKSDMNQMHSELSEASFDPEAQERQGNSLFSEVDDRRQIVESQLAKFKNKFEAIKVQMHQRSQQLAKVKMENIALMTKATSDDSHPHAKHMEELLMYQRAKSKGLEDMLAKGLSIEGKDYIRQKLEADEMILNLTRKVTELERSENRLKAENSKLKFDLQEAKEGSATKVAPPAAVAENREVLSFKKPFSVKENLVEESKEVDLLIRKLSCEPSEVPKTESKKKVAHFSSSVDVIEYVEPDPPIVESRIKKTNTVINAMEESDKLEREGGQECAQQ